MARIESSLAKKRLRDQEGEFLKHLRAERDISDRLLLNILPHPIADRLKRGEKVIADNFSEVTVLFSDFVGFTRLAAATSRALSSLVLNEIFSAFDELCDTHGLEKIKMMGTPIWLWPDYRRRVPITRKRR
jgi:class 3 adenylate cyclase